MRFATKLAAGVVFGGTLLADMASANLVLTRDKDASVSTLSEQLLRHSRNKAGNEKNVWDADPPEPAVNGFHYFLYNMNADGTSEADTFAAKSMTVTGIAAGPGYAITDAEVLLRGQGANQGNFFTNVNVSTSYEDPTSPNDFTNYIELGVLRVKFTLTDPSLAGNISAEDDSPEVAYASGSTTRGDEHVRVFTEFRDGHDDEPERGAMSAFVPTGFVPDGSTFALGYLDFGNGDVSTGYNVEPAAINTVVVAPEPAALAFLGAFGLLVRHRRTALKMAA